MGTGHITSVSLTSALEVSGQSHVPAVYPPSSMEKKSYRSSLKKRLGVSQSRSTLRELRVMRPPNLRVRRNKFWTNWQIFVKRSLNLITLGANYSLYFQNPTTNFNDFIFFIRRGNFDHILPKPLHGRIIPNIKLETVGNVPVCIFWHSNTQVKETINKCLFRQSVARPGFKLCASRIKALQSTAFTPHCSSWSFLMLQTRRLCPVLQFSARHVRSTFIILNTLLGKESHASLNKPQ
jgi:hypothetical protein